MPPKMYDMDGNEIPVGYEVLLSPKEVAMILRVDARTVSNWARAGKIRCVRTIGGQRRFPESAVRAVIDGDWEKAARGNPDPVMVVVPDK